jgi:hypothetical protein
MATETVMALLLSLRQLYLDRSQREGQGSGSIVRKRRMRRRGRKEGLVSTSHLKTLIISSTFTSELEK